MRNIFKVAMKFKKIVLISLVVILFSILYSNAESIEKHKINIDLNNDSNIDMIIVSLNNIKIYKGDKNRNFCLSHEFTCSSVKLSRFNQYNIIDNRSEMIFGQDISSPFTLKYDIGRVRYTTTYDIFSKDKFIIADINKDGLLDFIIIEEPADDSHGFYRHLIYYQGENCSFSNEPDKIIEERRSSWITGIYYDINKDGLPDKIEIRYKYYGALLSNTKCVISIYLMDSAMNRYKDKPDMRIVSTGIFYEDNNFRDINNDGYPDIFIVDVPKKPKSLEKAISRILNRRMDIVIKFYLYKKETKGYTLVPSFVKKINIDVLQDFSLSLDNDFNRDGYNDLLINQLNHSEIYTFEPKKLCFSETQLKY